MLDMIELVLKIGLKNLKRNNMVIYMNATIEWAGPLYPEYFKKIMAEGEIRHTKDDVPYLVLEDKPAQITQV